MKQGEPFQVLNLPMATPLPTILGSDAVLQVHQCFLVMQDEQGFIDY